MKQLWHMIWLNKANLIPVNSSLIGTKLILDLFDDLLKLCIGIFVRYFYSLGYTRDILL
jgi:hypothetical protein